MVLDIYKHCIISVMKRQFLKMAVGHKIIFFIISQLKYYPFNPTLEYALHYNTHRTQHIPQSQFYYASVTHFSINLLCILFDRGLCFQKTWQWLLVGQEPKSIL